MMFKDDNGDVNVEVDEGGERHTLPRGGGGGQEPKVAEWGEVGLLDDKPPKNW